jgi:YHS domain-containing protein
MRVAALLCAIAAPMAMAQETRQTEAFALTDAGVALQGYDPVSYFPEGGGDPTAGNASIATDVGGVTYHFLSDANRELFLQSPERYEPAYGGWCAWAMARDQRVEINPDAYSINGNRLYVFFNIDKRNDWLGEVDRDVERANTNWLAFSGIDEGPRLNPGLQRTTSKHQLNSKTLGLQGYDPVSYFAEGGAKPVKGNRKTTVTYRGIEYRFANTDNRDRFRHNPSRYEPAYGGWCAYACAKGDYTKPDPKTFRIQDERLMVFYNSWGTNTSTLWGKEGPETLERDADTFWSRETGEAVRR